MKTANAPITVSAREIGTYIVYAAIIAVMAVAMYNVAPKGFGQTAGVAFVMMLLPVPAIVLHFTRWRKSAR